MELHSHFPPFWLLFFSLVYGVTFLCGQNPTQKRVERVSFKVSYPLRKPLVRRHDGVCGPGRGVGGDGVRVIAGRQTGGETPLDGEEGEGSNRQRRRKKTRL